MITWRVVQVFGTLQIHPKSKSRPDERLICFGVVGVNEGNEIVIDRRLTDDDDRRKTKSYACPDEVSQNVASILK